MIWTIPFPAHPYRAKVERVVDGDTIVVIIDLGLDVSTTVHVRLDGINAPEIIGASHEQGAAAKKWLTDYLPSGTEVLVNVTGKSFARWVGQMIYNNKSVGTSLLEVGHAVPWTRPK